MSFTESNKRNEEYLKLSQELRDLAIENQLLKEEAECWRQEYLEVQNKMPIKKVPKKRKQFMPMRYEMKDSTVFLQEVYSYMQEKNMPSAEAWLALACHETDRFKSSLFRKGQNMFGLKAIKSAAGAYDFEIWSTGDQHHKMGFND